MAQWVKNPRAGKTGDVGSVLGLEDPLEKEIVAHSSISAWEISWADGTGRLPSMRLQRVTTSDLAQAHAIVWPACQVICL